MPKAPGPPNIGFRSWLGPAVDRRASELGVVRPDGRPNRSQMLDYLLRWALATMTAEGLAALQQGDDVREHLAQLDERDRDVLLTVELFGPTRLHFGEPAVLAARGRNGDRVTVASHTARKLARRGLLVLDEEQGAVLADTPLARSVMEALNDVDPDNGD